MLPHSYQLPAAVFLVLGGALSCFAGYRLFRFVMAIYGFLFGWAFASSMVGATNSTGMIIAGLVGTAFVGVSLSPRAPAAYLALSGIEILATLFIVWYAWTWRRPA